MKKRWAILIAAFIFAAVIFLLVGATVRETSPLKVGSTPDEAWTYIHTTGAWGRGTTNWIGVSQSHKWTADTGAICRETEIRWRSGLPFAFRKTTFYFGTNDTIWRVSTAWKYQWPFARTPSSSSALFVKTLRPNPNVFYQNLQHLPGASTNENTAEFLRQYLKSKGVDLSPPAALFIEERTGALIVRTTMRNHQKIEQIISTLNSPVK